VSAGMNRVESHRRHADENNPRKMAVSATRAFSLVTKLRRLCKNSDVLTPSESDAGEIDSEHRNRENSSRKAK
jgi:hypothetical protein